ncbi:hypothetical protein [Brochothrix thermosphacta]|uniref:hypothetical protein n=1 Tax=Brochothrix thermosphacta TaxID=2756 RepID=UPI003F974DDD
MFGKRKMNNSASGARTTNNHTTISGDLTRIPTPKPEPLKPAVAVLVEEFRNVQSELAERYKKAAKCLLKNEDLASVAYEKGDYIIIPLKNDLIKKHFTSISYANDEHVNQLKKSFKELGVSATYVHDHIRESELTYGEDEYESFVLNIRVIKYTLHGSGVPYYKYTLG